jgi:hypothetical protein
VRFPAVQLLVHLKVRPRVVSGMWAERATSRVPVKPAVPGLVAVPEQTPGGRQALRARNPDLEKEAGG